MREPTCAEVIDKWGTRDFFTRDSGIVEPDALLVERVKKILELYKRDGEEMTERRFYASYHDALEDVVRLLNGEAP